MHIGNLFFICQNTQITARLILAEVSLQDLITLYINVYKQNLQTKGAIP